MLLDYECLRDHRVRPLALLNDSKQVSDQTAVALKCLPSRGVKVVIASARPPRSVRHIYNLLDLERFRWSGPSLSAGKHIVVFDFKYDGPGPGKGGTGVLSVDGKESDRKTIPHSIPLLMTIDETFDIGVDTRSPVDFSYDLPFRFNGTIDRLNYKLGPEQLAAQDQKKVQEAVAKVND